MSDAENNEKRKEFAMKEFPITITKEDYLDACDMERKLQIWIRTGAIMVICGMVMVCYHFLTDKGLPPSPIMVNIVFFALSIGGWYCFVELKGLRKENDPDWIKNAFSHGTPAKGVYATFTAGDPDSPVFGYLFIGDERHERHMGIPFKKYKGVKPLACEALIYEDKALVTKVTGELDGYMSSEEYFWEIKMAEARRGSCSV